MKATNEKNKRRSTAFRGGRAGFTLLETVTVTAILSFIATAVLTLFGTANHLFRAGNVAADIDEQARLAVSMVAGELKQTGCFTDEDTGKRYIYIFEEGGASGDFSAYSHSPVQHQAEDGTAADGPTREVVFRTVEDVDGDGYLIDAGTGAIEWSPDEISYQLRTGPDGINQLERRVNNSSPKIIARFVERFAVDDITTDASVPYGQVRIMIHLRKKTTDGRIIKASYSTLVSMRNYDWEQ